MKNNEDLKREIENLKKQVEKTKLEKTKLDEAKDKLQDEVDSLWAMMDEMTKSDVENWSHLVDQLKDDVISKALMVTKKKADC